MPYLTTTDPHDPGAETAALRARADGSEVAATLRPGEGREIRFGTASWTDPTITHGGVFYPPHADSAEARLRYYASRFSVVEVDSTYYALPARRTAELWNARTPVDFTFDVKANALMTGQPTQVRSLPRSLREALPQSLAAKPRIYGKDLPRELYDEVWRIFRDALEPLHSSGKLGSVLLQYPRWFLPREESLASILEARERLAGLDSAVELRNASWFDARNVERTLAFMEAHEIPFVMVDEPQGFRSSVPPIVAVTSPYRAVIRFHGRRSADWERAGVPVVDRFRYLYDRAELETWVERIIAVAELATTTHVIMNNCYANYGTTNALELSSMVREAYLASGHGLAS